MIKIRNLKFVLGEISPELEEYAKRFFACLNEINQRVVAYMQQGYRFEQRHKGYYCHTPAGNLLTDAKFCEKYLGDLYQKYMTKKAKTTFRGMYNLVVRQYQGYLKRNEAPTKRIHLKEKTISLKDSDMSLVDGKIRVKNIFGDDFDLEYQELGCLKHIAALPKKFGGNIVLKQRCLIVKVDVDYDFAYAPLKMMSIDINKANKNWLYLNDGRKIAKPDNILHLEEIITSINKQIKDKTINTKQRKRLRLRWKKLHRKHNKLIQTIVNDLLDEAVQQQALVAIDTVKTGQSNGTFGQDKLVATLITQCEERSIPFTLTPCAYTSQRCYSCGNIDKKNRKEEKFLCTDCGLTCHADFNGAMNLAIFANALYLANMVGLVDKYEATQYLRGQFNFPK